MAHPRTFTVSDDDDGIRLDRWFKRHMPDVSFNIVSRWTRTGQLRLNGNKAAPGDRIEAGQEISVPPADDAAPRTGRPERKRKPLTEEEVQLVRDMVIYRDPGAFVLNKPEVFIREAAGKIDQAGNLTDDATKEFVRKLLEALAAWTDRLRAPSSPGA